MKKKIILLALFIGPLLFFLFLATGHVNHDSLPVFSKDVTPIANFNKEVTFKEKITVLTFLGKRPKERATEIFNLNEVVFKKISKYKNFQLITVYDTTALNELNILRNRLLRTSGDFFHKWKFIALDSLQTQKLFNSLDTETTLNEFNSSKQAFIIDKFGLQRGRKDDDKIGDIMKQYDMTSVNSLKNKLYDDVEVTFFEQFNKGRKSREERLRGEE